MIFSHINKIDCNVVYIKHLVIILSIIHYVIKPFLKTTIYHIRPLVTQPTTCKCKEFTYTYKQYIYIYEQKLKEKVLTAEWPGLRRLCPWPTNTAAWSSGVDTVHGAWCRSMAYNNEQDVLLVTLGAK